MALVDRNGVYGAPRFHMAAKKAGVRAHIGSEITCTNGVSYPLLVETREGYQNLCRLVTRMKLRANKGRRRGHPGRARRILPRPDLPHAPSRRAPARDFRPRTPLRRTAAPLPSRRGGAQPGHRRARARVSASRWWPPTAWPTPRPRSANCWTSSPASATKSRWPPPAACWSAIPSATSRRPPRWRACSPIFPRPSPTRCEISSRLEFTLADLGYEFPRYPVPEGETMMSLPAQARGRRRAPPLPAVSRARPPADRARTGAHRKAGAGGLFPDRLGHRALLPRERHPGAGPRLGRQQRGLLRARNHRGRSGRHGPAVRALPFRRARRVARHRYRPAQRRQARARHPVRLPALRQAGRGHDGQRHHLSRPLRRARSGQGAGLRNHHAGAALRPGARVGMERSRRTPPSASSAKPASTSTIRACANFSSCTAWRRICRATWASIPAAW